MRNSRNWTSLIRSFVGCLFACALLGPARADSAPAWTRVELVGRYSFKGTVLEDKDLSGIACVSDRYGLVGADEGRAVQTVELSGKARTLTVTGTIPLLDSGAEIDIEAIAAEAGSYYVVGSHGVAKKTGESQANRFKVFRLKANPATGSAVVQDAASLSDLLGRDPVLGAYFRKPLQHRGLNIEGLAVRNGRLFFGFRGPNLDGAAFVLEIRADDAFSDKSRPAYTLHRLALGDGLGIREIVAARTGFLLIAGNSGAEPSERYPRAENYRAGRGYSLFAWDGKGARVHEIGPIPNVPGKAEAMTILDESPDHVTVLILFDGPKGGRPSVYRID
ncbi:MAG: DUF3616 domain-containing protein [Sedimentisphaerales bacterium]|nr:DUF3616 domain-containing protein [Sedimentisphaerales bacterium]